MTRQQGHYIKHTDGLKPYQMLLFSSAVARATAQIERSTKSVRGDRKQRERDRIRKRGRETSQQVQPKLFHCPPSEAAGGGRNEFP